MNIDTKWMMKVFQERQIRIAGWMGESIDGDRLELILADARREELALKKSITKFDNRLDVLGFNREYRDLT